MKDYTDVGDVWVDVSALSGVIPEGMSTSFFVPDPNQPYASGSVVQRLNLTAYIKYVIAKEWEKAWTKREPIYTETTNIFEDEV